MAVTSEQWEIKEVYSAIALAYGLEDVSRLQCSETPDRAHPGGLPELRRSLTTRETKPAGICGTRKKRAAIKFLISTFISSILNTSFHELMSYLYIFIGEMCVPVF